MSISGCIVDVKRDGADLILYLGEVQRATGYSDPVGQPQLRVLSATWVPPIGAIIWGGGGSVRIEAAGGREYLRVGYTRLQEARIDRARMRLVACPFQPESGAQRGATG